MGVLPPVVILFLFSMKMSFNTHFALKTYSAFGEHNFSITFLSLRFVYNVHVVTMHKPCSSIRSMCVERKMDSFWYGQPLSINKMYIHSKLSKHLFKTIDSRFRGPLGPSHTNMSWSCDTSFRTFYLTY